MKRVVGYIRVSTTLQVEKGNSLQDQKKRIQAECKNNGWDLLEIYSDEGVSGQTSSRAGLQQLLKDCDSGLFDIVVFTKLDRLGRNLRDILNILYQLKENSKTSIHCCDDPLISTATGPFGQALIQLMGIFAELERKMIRDRSMTGRMSSWKAGKSIMGSLPFGYYLDKKNGNIKIDKNLKTTVEKIFQLYVDDRLSMRDIALELSKLGFPTPSQAKGHKRQAKQWSNYAVQHILKNEAYKGGAVIFNKYKYGLQKGGYSGATSELKPQNEWITLHFPQIITEERWNAVQTKRRFNIRKPKKGHKKFPDKFLAENLLKCGKCGGRIRKEIASIHTDQPLFRYVCYWRIASPSELETLGKKRCNSKRVDADEVDKLIFNEIANILTNPKTYLMDWISSRSIDETQEQVNQLKAKEKSLEGQVRNALEQVTAADEPLLQKICQEHYDDVKKQYLQVLASLNKWENKLSMYDDRLEQIKEIESFFQLPISRGRGVFQNKVRRFMNSMDFQEKKKLIESVIRPEEEGHIVLYTDYVGEDYFSEIELDFRFDFQTSRVKQLITDLNKKDLLNKSVPR